MVVWFGSVWLGKRWGGWRGRVGVGENKSKGKYAGKHEGERKKSENEELFLYRERERAVRCSASQQSSKRWATRAKSLARLILTAAFALSALMLSKQRSLLRNADTLSETNVPRNV